MAPSNVKWCSIFDDGAEDATLARSVSCFRRVHRETPSRGNKPGIAADFSLGEERLAFPIRAQHDEVDYLVNYPAADPVISATLTAHDDALEMCRRHLPAALSEA
jgi:hypothetical protein